MQSLSDEATRVLVADPTRENRVSLVDILSSSGISCVEAADGVSAWTRFTSEKPDLILAALRLPGLTALDLLTRVRDVSTTPLIVQVPAGEFASALTAIRSGAADVIPFPCNAVELLARIRAALATNIRRSLPEEALSKFAGRSNAAARIREQMKALAGLRIPVLFRGEDGSGRDHAVACLARLDGVEAKDVLKLTPASGPYRTRNDASKTVFIDGLELHSRLDQAYWAQRILESEQSIGGAPRRVFASTTSDLELLLRRGEVDAKLAETVLRFVVNIPPLRERPEDVIPLAASLSHDLSRRIGRSHVTFTAPALKLLQQQPWPGNVAQLATAIEKLVAFSPDGLVTRRLVSSLIEETPASIVSLRQAASRRQRDELIAILDQTGGNLAEAARRMSMSRGAIIYRAQKFGLLAKRVRAGARVASKPTLLRGSLTSSH